MNLLTLSQLNPTQRLALLRLATTLASSATSNPLLTTARKRLAHRSIALLFFENSTRTRASFETAAAQLALHPLALDISTSSTAKGESFADTIRTIAALDPAAIILRHADANAAHIAASHSTAPIINAGTGTKAHPTQALLDAATIATHALPRLNLPAADPDQPFQHLRIAITGDIARSRVARSLIRLLPSLGAELSLVGPPGFLPDRFALLGFPIHRSINDALTTPDSPPHILYALRVQHERASHADDNAATDAFISTCAIRRETLDKLAPNALIMHPGPVNWGVELDAALANDTRSLILHQVAMGVPTRTAVILAATGLADLNTQSQSRPTT